MLMLQLLTLTDCLEVFAMSPTYIQTRQPESLPKVKSTYQALVL